MDTTVTIIGAGQAGLAMSKCLSERSIDHVLLERGNSAHSWRTERWDSLRLLTPNWLTRLPGYQYGGNDPDGYMSAAQVAQFLEAFRDSFSAPVISECEVTDVRASDEGFVTSTNQGVWHSRAVVIATGACSCPHIPMIAADFPAHVRQLAPIQYKNPDDVDTGRVLVVGASASGAQLADELARAGRNVTLAVGDHVRLPRTYRGMDIHWWMDAIGALDEHISEMDDPSRARRLPSLQLIGTPERRSLGLNELQQSGVELIGRLAAVTDTKLQFSGGFANQVASADLKMNRLLARIDEFAIDAGLDAEIESPQRPLPTMAPDPRLSIGFEEIETVIWATGFRPQYPWLDPSLLDRKGGIVHDGGVMSQPGMYVIGLPFTRRRKSSFIDGVGPDAYDLSAQLVRHLDSLAAPTA